MRAHTCVHAPGTCTVHTRVYTCIHVHTFTPHVPICSSVTRTHVCMHTYGDLGSIPGLGRSPGEGRGSPLQRSGLENSRDCTVHWVAKSWTQLISFHFHTHTHRHTCVSTHLVDIYTLQTHTLYTRTACSLQRRLDLPTRPCAWHCVLNKRDVDTAAASPELPEELVFHWGCLEQGAGLGGSACL